MSPRQIALTDLPGLVGQETGVSDWLEITQERVNQFAEATGDRQWIHVDVARATAELGSTIAHGFLTLSLIPMLSQQAVHVTGVSRALNGGCDGLRFLNPVRVGERVRLRMTLAAVEAKSGGLRVVNACTVDIEGRERPACVVQTIALLYGEG